MELQKNEIELILSEIRKIQQPACPELRRVWLPRQEVMEYLNYGSTQILEFIKEYNLITARFGKRNFIGTDSLLRVLNESQGK